MADESKGLEGDGSATSLSSAHAKAATAMMEGWVRLCDPESREGLESRLRRLREACTGELAQALNPSGMQLDDLLESVQMLPRVVRYSNIMPDAEPYHCRAVATLDDGASVVFRFKIGGGAVTRGSKVTHVTMGAFSDGLPHGAHTLFAHKLMQEVEELPGTHVLWLPDNDDGDELAGTQDTRQMDIAQLHHLVMEERRLLKADPDPDHPTLMQSQDLRLAISTGATLGPLDERRNAKTLFLQRTVRDASCVTLFALYWLLMFCVCIYAFSNGNPERLVNGFDSNGNVCGVKTGNVDLTAKQRLWWPTPTDKTVHFCVDRCPTAQDVTDGTKFDNYLAGGDPVPTTVTVATVSLSNRCLPVGSGITDSIGSMASLFADLSAGWPAAFAGALLSLLFGYVWLFMLVKGTKCGIVCTVPLAFMALIGVAGALMGSAGALKTPTGMTKEEAEAVVASGGAVLCIIGALVVLVVGVALVVSACRRRSGKHFATDMAGFIAGILNTKCKALLRFPLLNFVTMSALLALWAVVAMYLVSIGTIEQECVCPLPKLTDCTCYRSFQFGVWGRIFAAMHLFGLVWSVALINNIAAATTAAAISSFYWAETNYLVGDSNIGQREVPAKRVWTLYKNTLKYNMGSIIFASALQPVLAVQRPIVFLVVWLRSKINHPDCCSTCTRCLLGFAALVCCCFEAVAYFDLPAALVLMGERNTGLFSASKVGFQLRRRNAGRVKGLVELLDTMLVAGKAMVAACSMFIAFMIVEGIRSGSDDMSVGAPAVLYLLVALVCLGPASLITSQFSMCLDAVLLNFYEDIERNSSTGDVFMPEEFRRYVDKFGYVVNGVLPADQFAHVNKMFLVPEWTKKMKLVHSDGGKFTFAKLNESQTRPNPEISEAELTAEFPQDNGRPTWRLTVTRPMVHISQPSCVVRCFVSEYAEPSNVKLCGRRMFGKPAREVETPAVDSGEGPVVFAPRVQLYRHAQKTHKQMKALRQCSIRSKVIVSVTKVLRRLVSEDMLGDDNKGALTFPPFVPLDAAERARLLETDFNTTQRTRSVIFPDHELTPMQWMTAAGMKRRPGENDMEYALRWYQFVQIHFYYNLAHEGGAVGMIRNDFGVCGTTNCFYVMGLRANGIPARCLVGNPMSDNDNSTVMNGMDGEMSNYDFSSSHCLHEWFCADPPLGWIPGDATPGRDFKKFTKENRHRVLREAYGMEEVRGELRPLDPFRAIELIESGRGDDIKRNRYSLDMRHAQLCISGFGTSGEGAMLLGSVPDPKLEPPSQTMRREMRVIPRDDVGFFTSTAPKAAAAVSADLMRKPVDDDVSDPSNAKLLAIP